MHQKNNIRLKIIRHVRKKGRKHFLVCFICGPYNRLKNLSAAVNATRNTTTILLREKRLEQKFFCFLRENCLILARAELTDATQARHRLGSEGRAPSHWAVFVILRQKIAIITPFQSHFARFWGDMNNYSKLLKSWSLKELNFLASSALLTSVQVQTIF